MNAITCIPSPGQFKMPPLSGAARPGELLFVSGTPGYHADGRIDEGDFDAQFDQSMAVLTQLLGIGGSSLRSVLKVNVLLTRLEDVTLMNQRYARAVGSEPYPARTTSVVLSLPDPRMLLEIECVAAVEAEA
ncbi:RidA family protein [Variovorax sp. 770b2]|uniref:RidA family protein n=1 Tax=Variovorax sp. 770b2 TaxID=1566271 RepID=UPI0008F402F8|nr:RidA family protein [Variovorax sp. 770b2]SFQ32859.1 Enamine deaminase RidA, house cleaning of reactive enamine intermediates, YjgF/YER057c/UK114 family [Variovorax sp. 770b2]